MSTQTRDLIEICEKLPEAKQVEVADFARFLLAQQGDEGWEQIVAEAKARPKLQEFLKASKSEGSQPLDPEQL
jgi:hypothetical protein